MADTGLQLGVRCIRGADWNWDNQDGGPGHAGTVVLIGSTDNPHCLPGSVMVLWDNGFCNNYHAGRSNLYDLRVLDTGPSGIVHENALCAGCSADRIFGIRWTCNQCLSVHLCSRCYHLKYHDLTHEFIRYLVPGGHGVVVPCRAASQTPTEIHGIFRSAVVVRGQDWKWGDQDGGVGSQGLVKEIANWKDLTGNSVACVIWHGSKAENLYRVGHDSKVDVRCIKPGSGGKIYTTHLPLLGKSVDSVQTFKIGQTVEMCVDLPTLIQLQAGHGEYRPEMAVVVGRKGRVHRITEKGDVRVQFAAAAGTDAKFSRWTLNPMALKSVKVFAVGEQVKITNDKSLIARYHTNHAVMSGYSGLTARIQLLHSESSATVDLGHGRVITLHPAILEHKERQQETVPTQNMNERFMSLACSGDVMEVEKILSNPLLIPDNNALLIALHKAANLGLLAVVSSIVRFRPVLVNQKLEQKTVLMVAAYQGYVEILRTLLSSGGDGSIPDQAGDLPIHYAAIGSKPAAILTLIDRGSPINSQNKEGRTPLHQAVIGRSMETLTALLKAGAAVNIQDKNGETPLQIAINMKNEDTASLMVDQADLLVFENNGWNSLHLAVRAGLPKLVEQLIQTDRRCVNIVTRDRQAPLHIAVASENLDVIKCLLKTPECDINIQDDQGRSGLHYAALNANSSVLLLLLEHSLRCDVSLQDRDGNTAAHLAVIGSQSIGTENRYNNDLEAVFDPVHIDRLTQMEIPSCQILRVGLMLMLFHHGADRDTRNLAGDTPINLIENCDLQQFIVDYLVRPAAAEPVGAEPDYAEIQENMVAGPQGAVGGVEVGVEADPGMAVEKECRICCEQTDLMTFHPCQHKLVCKACCIRMKKCLECNTVIDKKTIESATVDKKDIADILKKVQDLEDQFLCGICMERKRNVAFLCGHGACQPCTQSLLKLLLYLKLLCLKMNLLVLTILSVIILPGVLAIEPLTTGIGLTAAGSVLWMAKDKILCQFSECCQEPYIRNQLSGFQQMLDDKLFGQHIAKSVVYKTLYSHLRKFEPKKALVLSFHGMTGAGKNYLAQLIAENIYKEGTNSKYVHIYLSTVHFPDKDRVEFYKNQLQNEIKARVKSCARSLFIFDEVDDMDPGIIDAIKPFLDYHPVIDGVDYRKSIFIFLSNTGAQKIYTTAKKNWESGLAREDLKLEHFDESLNNLAYNSEGGLKKTDIIERALIDAAVPFLPLEKKHVMLCIQAEIDKHNLVDQEEESRPMKDYTEDDLSALAELRSYDKEGVFSKMGCKKLESLVAAFMEEY